VKLTMSENLIVQSLLEHKRILIATITRLRLMKEGKIPTEPVGFVFPEGETMPDWARRH
jgi:hypothetical protein